VQEQERSAILDEVPSGTSEEELLGQGTGAAIREMRLRGKSKKAIARELELDIKTVRKWSRREWEPQRRRAHEVDLAAYGEVIGRRFPEVGYNAMVLYRELRKAGYGGSERRVRRFVEPLRAAVRPETVTLRFETGPGEQAQVDWGMIGVWIGEQRVKVHLFVMVLGFSRRIFVRAYEHERLGNLLDGHEAALALQWPDADSALRQPADDRVVQGRGQRHDRMEPPFQGPDGLLWRGGEAVPVLPGADRGEGRERGQVREAERAGGSRASRSSTAGSKNGRCRSPTSGSTAPPARSRPSGSLGRSERG
jgi:transposase